MDGQDQLAIALLRSSDHDDTAAERAAGVRTVRPLPVREARHRAIPRLKRCCRTCMTRRS